jgi:hypothetical protein
LQSPFWENNGFTTNQNERCAVDWRLFTSRLACRQPDFVDESTDLVCVRLRLCACGWQASATGSTSDVWPLVFQVMLVAGNRIWSKLSVLGCALSAPFALRPHIWLLDQLPVPMVMLIKLLNDGALWLSSRYDRVRPSPVYSFDTPFSWFIDILNKTIAF